MDEQIQEIILIEKNKSFAIQQSLLITERCFFFRKFIMIKIFSLKKKLNYQKITNLKNVNKKIGLEHIYKLRKMIILHWNLQMIFKIIQNKMTKFLIKLLLLALKCLKRTMIKKKKMQLKSKKIIKIRNLHMIMKGNYFLQNLQNSINYLLQIIQYHTIVKQKKTINLRFLIKIIEKQQYKKQFKKIQKNRVFKKLKNYKIWE
ncbi:hypothetical protein IMG5_019030 [Ichthyophthirius multifiliis]|uniref:Uncharacterized protein n=1 Tax=Ichthyophthirius multifiliis TaxID=5932 RepID=G0QKK5_ICHMU|nr:hypothetical protein IMG5_019030 [Ichthyophthirius multifiliis]EGR34256.1 hypothetical protein IMG5_019030 [Ichthyophthirius multifiliis]|eukprot:XP_004039560.1 hypothetical protein IMG5_019030 [Ichthyophthirius multifiliis]